jgi:hypothetical protein
MLHSSPLLIGCVRCVVHQCCIAFILHSVVLYGPNQTGMTIVCVAARPPCDFPRFPCAGYLSFGPIASLQFSCCDLSACTTYWAIGWKLRHPAVPVFSWLAARVSLLLLAPSSLFCTLAAVAPLQACVHTHIAMFHRSLWSDRCVTSFVRYHCQHHTVRCVFDRGTSWILSCHGVWEVIISFWKTFDAALIGVCDGKPSPQPLWNLYAIK